ncbi:MAG: hypothetical protein JJE55_08350 [Flavobacteriaceae bacterium]|nr:hypothetical protein [Flavobacteriaceae bacterium]
MNRLRVFISGQKYFGEEVFDLCSKIDGVEIVGICVPVGDRYLGRKAQLYNIPIIPAGSLNGDTMPLGVDLGITAHSFDYIGAKTRYRPRLGWIGYHPSLLPRHRGRSSIEWAIRMRDVITGGTVFWLNAGIDRGDIAYQDWCFIEPRLFALPPNEAARELWQCELQQMGLKLIETALKDILKGVIIKRPQSADLSTFEPNTEVKDIYRPDLLMIEEKASPSTSWHR